MRITILTPGQIGSNPRVVKEADALHEGGHDVHVIATCGVDFVEPHDQSILARAKWSITRLPLPGPLVWKASRALQRAAALGTGMGVRQFQMLAASPWTVRLAEAAVARPSDLYIAHYTAALPAAAAAARHHGTRYAFDAEDFHPGDFPGGPEHRRARQVVMGIEATHLPGAAYVSAASPGIAEAYRAAYQIAEPTVLTNVFARSDAPQATSPRGATVPGPSLYWFSQTIGPDRGLEAAVAALVHARSRPHLYLRGTPAAGFAQTLQDLAAAHGVAERLHLLAPEDPGDMVRLAAQFDVGLVAETGHSHNRRIAWTNKQFTYTLAGVPSLMSDIPAHRAFAQDAADFAFLYQVDDPHSLAAALDALLLDPTRLSSARSAAFEAGQQRFNWDLEQDKLRAIVCR